MSEGNFGFTIADPMQDAVMDIMGMATDLTKTMIEYGCITTTEEATASLKAFLTALTDGPDTAGEGGEVAAVEQKSPQEIAASITPDGLMSFEDGRWYRSLKRHLTARGLSPEEYRAKHGLDESYPMTAPAYSARRSELAKASGLGTKRVEAPAPVARRKRAA